MGRTDRLVASVTLSPCVDNVLFVDPLNVGDRNQVLQVERDAGGKGVNLARAIHRLGGDALATGFLGGHTGALITSVLDAEGVAHDFVRTRSESRTNWYIECANQQPTALSGISPLIRAEELAMLEGELSILFRDSAWVALGGAVPRGVSHEIYAQLTEMAHQYGCKVLIDSDGDALDIGLNAGPDLIKPNVHEAERLVGRKIGTEAEALDAAEDLLDRLKEIGGEKVGYSPVVILSRGSDGAVMCCSKGRYGGRAPSVKVRSTIGSGDSMLAAVIWAMQEQKAPEDWLRWGIAAGAATAVTTGSEIGSLSLILQLLDQTRVERV